MFQKSTTEEEYNKLKDCEYKIYFKYLLYHLGIVERWQSEAKQATEQLEQLTGQKFEDNSIKHNIEPLSEEEKKR